MRFIGKLENLCIYDMGEREDQCQDFSFRAGKSEGYGEFTFVYGPSAGGLTESVQFMIKTSGEQILEIEANPYFKKRKLKFSGRIEDVILTVERINAMFSASHSLSFIIAVERSVDVNVDYEVMMARIVELELERIRNHLHVLHKLAETGALGVASYQLQEMEERTNRLIGEVCGHRYFFSSNWINSVKCNLEKVRLDYLNGFNSFFNDMLENRILIDRFQNNGKIDQDWLIGPAARASGRSYDSRYDSDSLPYKDLGFSPIVERSPDTFGRFLIRGLEILQSIEIIRGALGKAKNVRGGEVKVKGVGSGMSRVESPSGDLVYKVKIDDGFISTSFLPPSKANLSFFLKSVIGTIFTDFPFNWEGFGIWISEIGVEKE
ncbi:hypothetical protein [Sulfuracidifex metallicus]|uniref:Formate hydrogenlyase n=1 Tax=Sulfuracidifex metallicus DSM 6482 = JCM 9184 TaxID=523847 RepID=A0A6A9QN89_SULME|nr:hypothetical protein [Sulfuracidifex metallicus]MUN30004.1 formate hydrogenlyase [Sulfuracidifex metallicus DSM 6482 = JCM 9184]WOE51615.1 formate hydrogenlyase [Sulfuracidifex metallicus DSM 6482 = JCM 9184]